MTESNKPIINIRDKGFSFSVFKRENEGRTYYGGCLQRSYLIKDGDAKNQQDWKRESINLFPDDVFKVANLLKNGYDALLEYVQTNKPTTSYPAQSMDQGEDPFGDDLGGGL